MNYAIRHMTRFQYSAPITGSVMDVYMQPRGGDNQRVLSFELTLNPTTPINGYTDFMGNGVNSFDIPRPHNRLIIKAESIVEVRPSAPLPAALTMDDWERLDEEAEEGDFWDMLMPSHFVHDTPLVQTLVDELQVDRRHDPLTALRKLNSAIYDAFGYAPQTTEADSQIDEALESRRGVCQDFAHIMLTVLRFYLKIPGRYVSGYLYTGANDDDRSAEDATHAWVEAFLPGLGWVGFDPTNNLIVSDRHICVAIGRDYYDVPPTRGVYKGEAKTELSVGVQVKITDDVPFDQNLLPDVPEIPYDTYYQQQLMEEQQQQQQQQQQ